MNAVGAMATPWRPDEYGAPVLVSLGLHVLVVLLLVSNLSFCEQKALLPPVPAHVKAVLLERAPPRKPVVAERPAPVDIVIPKIVMPPRLSPPPEPVAAPAPKAVEKTLARREPAKAQAEPVQAKPKPPPPPDFSAMLAQEEQTLAQREALRREAARQSQQSRQEVDVRTAQNQKVVEEYTALIAAAIQQRWLRPATVRAGMSAEFRITLLPGGDVRDVRLAKSSGDAAFDQSAENAIRLAGRLPVPADPAVFNAGFRQFTFRFRPEDSKQ